MNFDNKQAVTEGWWIDPWSMTIEPMRAPRKYWSNNQPQTSDEARAFVQRKANEGSAYHIEALAYVAFAEPLFEYTYALNPAIMSLVKKITPTPTPTTP